MDIYEDAKERLAHVLVKISKHVQGDSRALYERCKTAVLESPGMLEINHMQALEFISLLALDLETCINVDTYLMHTFPR